MSEKAVGIAAITGLFTGAGGNDRYEYVKRTVFSSIYCTNYVLSGQNT